MSEEADILAPENQNQGETEAVSQTDSAPVNNEPEAQADTGDSSADSEKESKNKVQKRIDQLTREKYEAKRQAEEYRKQLEAQKPKAEAPKPPKESEFDDLDEYEQAKLEYAADMAAYKLKQDQAKEQEQQRANEARTKVQERTKKYVERIQSEATQYEGFFDKVSDPVFSDIVNQMDVELVGLIQESDKATALTYALANDIELTARLSQLSPIQAARELALIEAKIDVPQPKKVSEAPEPIKPIGSGESASVDPSKMSTEQWIAWRRKKKYG